jgi:hypothetical protein
MRRHPLIGTQQLHRGLDYGGAFPVLAAADGFVVAVGFMPSKETGFGHYSIIEHPKLSLRTLYAHGQHAPLMARGHTVRAGQKVFQSGTTGASTGNHLHFEVHKRDQFRRWVPVNPAPYFITLAGNAGVPIVQKEEDDMLVFISVEGEDAVRVVGGGFRYQFTTAGELDAFRNVLEASGHDVPPIVQVSSWWSSNLMWNASPPPAAGSALTAERLAQVIREQLATTSTPSASVNLKPLLEAVQALPDAVAAELAQRLTE